jgi:hypothetical protein
MLTAFAQWYTIHYANRLQRLPDTTLSPLDVLHEMEYGSAHSRESHATWRSVRVLRCLCPISTVEPCGIAARAMTVLLPAAAGRLPPDDMLTCISHCRSYADLQASRQAACDLCTRHGYPQHGRCPVRTNKRRWPKRRKMPFQSIQINGLRSSATYSHLGPFTALACA